MATVQKKECEMGMLKRMIVVVFVSMMLFTGCAFSPTTEKIAQNSIIGGVGGWFLGYALSGSTKTAGRVGAGTAVATGVGSYIVLATDARRIRQQEQAMVQEYKIMHRIPKEANCDITSRRQNGSVVEADITCTNVPTDMVLGRKDVLGKDK
jgi:hypothetical protein